MAKRSTWRVESSVVADEEIEINEKIRVTEVERIINCKEEVVAIK
jgi:hypothetical protein